MSSSAPSARPTDDTFRKVELQSSADFAFLAQLLLDRAEARVGEALPGGGGGGGGAAAADPIRDRVRARVREWAGRVCGLANGSVVVNGVEVPEDRLRREIVTGAGEVVYGDDVTEHEPIDSKLAGRLRRLEAQKDALTEQVADLRRTAPAAAAGRWDSTAVEAEAEAEQGGRRRGREGEGEGGGDEEADEVLAAFRAAVERAQPALKRTEAEWADAAAELAGLETRLAEDLARARRAHDVVCLVEAKASRGLQGEQQR